MVTRRHLVIEASLRPLLQPGAQHPEDAEPSAHKWTVPDPYPLHVVAQLAYAQISIQMGAWGACGFIEVSIGITASLWPSQTE